jgi:hypothetical protein
VSSFVRRYSGAVSTLFSPRFRRKPATESTGLHGENRRRNRFARDHSKTSGFHFFVLLSHILPKYYTYLKFELISQYGKKLIFVIIYFLIFSLSPSRSILEDLSVFFSLYNSIPATNSFSFVFVNSRVGKA